MMEFSFSFDQASPEARQAFRARIPGLEARDGVSGVMYPVHDVSAGGMSLEDKAQAIRHGEVLKADLCFKGRALITDLSARNTRHVQGIAGMKFENVTRRQEERLD